MPPVSSWALFLGVVAQRGRRRGQGQQVTECIHRQMNLGALALLRAIEPRAMPTLRGALQCAAVNDDRRGLTPTLLNATQQAQVVHGILKTPRVEPPLRLAADHLCRWQIVRQKRPLRPGSAH